LGVFEFGFDFISHPPKATNYHHDPGDWKDPREP
jgi:hypothetical protein